MKTILIPLAALALAVSPAAHAEGKSYNAKDFSRIEIDGAMNVVFKTGSATSVRVEASNGDFTDLRLVNKGDTLVVSRNSLKAKGGWLNWGQRSVSVSDDGKTIKVNGRKVPVYTVYLTSPDLESVTAAQSSRFDSSSIGSETLDASASSSSIMTLAGEVSNARLQVSSSAEIRAAELAVGTLRVSASSSGEAEVLSSGTGEASIEASSSGDIRVKSGAAASFVVNVSSGASVELSGSCGRMSVSASSGASVDATGLLCETSNVSVSSGADVEAFASGTAAGNASSGGSVSFSGKPGTQDVTESSGGSISFTG